MTTQNESIAQLKATSIPSTVNKFKKGDTLRRRLVTTILPAVLIPLVVASAIGYSITERRTREQSLKSLEEQARVATDTVEVFIKDSFVILNLIGSNPDVRRAMQAGFQQVQTQGLPQQSIEELEQKFANTKLLNVNSNLNNYLRGVVSNSSITEIFFTESNGFNVAYSNPTSDFVQNDEAWWQNAKQDERAIDEPEFDESANTTVIAFSQAVTDSQTGELLGVIKAGIPVTELNTNLAAYLTANLEESQAVQIVDVDADDFDADSIVSTINSQGLDTEQQEVIGGEAIVEVGKILLDSLENSRSLEETKQIIQDRGDFSNISLKQEEIFSEIALLAKLRYEDKIYELETIPNTDLITIASIDNAAIAAASRSLLTAFAVTAIVLGTISLGLVVILAQQFSQPLIELSDKTQQAAAGNLDTTAKLQGTSETRILADNFNNLVRQVKESLQGQQALTDEQRQERERLEREIFQLLEEIGDATEGDLTVRASLSSMEMSTVSDLFNAIIDSLQEIAIEAKSSSSQVGSSLKQNEEAIRQLAEQAVAETKETRNTLVSVEQMSQSIQEVAENASQAEQITDDTYNTIVTSTSSMDSTVDSILSLRTIVAETAKKMKRLGESSQKISQAVSFIEEIALRTNVLSINATVEAGRAGEYGEGFTIVAEQVGALSEQCAAATKEIASIVATIQAETQDVNQAMESGTAQVVETTRLVESTKQSLNLVLEKSRTINQLMSSISQTTVSQANTSQSVTSLMQKIARLSATTSTSSQQVAESIAETALVAQKLESAVAQFKVAESS